ncbi:MAG: galactosyldiacylglycerol synthase [Roseiflexaceae bacterium]|nr:galactosyldiacylglycerol synthase [Roseiflexaceae bacterium]
MVMLHNQATGQELGAVSDEDFQFLQTSLEEESVEDDAYYIDLTTIDLLRSSGASASLLRVLEADVSGGEGVEVQWRELEA